MMFKRVSAGTDAHRAAMRGAPAQDLRRKLQVLWNMSHATGVFHFTHCFREMC